MRDNEKRHYTPLEITNLNTIHPDSVQGQAILSAHNARLPVRSLGGKGISEYPHTVTEFKRREIILHESNVKAARTWFLTGFYVGGGLACVAGGGYAVSLAAAAIGLHIIGVKMIIIAVSVLGLIFALTKVKTTKRVIHEHQGGEQTINKTYNQYNECNFN